MAHWNNQGFRISINIVVFPIVFIWVCLKMVSTPKPNG